MAFTFVFAILVYGLLCLPGYILTAVSLFSIADRRGVQFPWLAWIPGLRFYLMGCISDQYQAIVRGKNRNKRTVLLLLTLIMLAAFCAMHFMAPDGTQDSLLPFLLIFVPAWIACAVLVVVLFMSLHDIYVSCDPKNAVLFLVLSIVLPITQPVFLFLCRKKDLGFPL